jgi:3-polyprenyl-4-hydroxybenzoate decarboxylase
VQWSRDAWTVDGLPTSTLDPSLSVGVQTGSKLAVDATRGKPGVSDVPRATVPAASMVRARALIAAAAVAHWPAD